MGLNVNSNDAIYSVLNLDQDGVTGMMDRMVLVKKDLGSRSGIITLETSNLSKSREDIVEGT